MIKAAGIMFLTDAGETLLLKRGPGGDWPGAWCFPGGEAKGDETLEQTAERETIEELGFLPKGDKRVWTRRISNNEMPDFQTNVDPMPEEIINPVPPLGQPVDYTTFVQVVKERFEPELNGEHTGFAWCKIAEPPEPMHPGAAISLKRFFMDELEVAKCIRDGDLISPQHFENVWLFALRITGTGTAYRRRLDEYVYRKPENYLTPEFLERCNGLPVIWEHPEAGKLDGKEFADRIIGTILLPYIQGDEVWGIAKIYDEDAAKLMATKQLSTSPAVVFRHTDGNVHAKLENGRSLLVEGKPSLLDHLAICEEGVWDKGGEPAGVELSTSKTSGGENMPDVEKEVKAAEERSDAETGNIDKLLMGIDALCDRLDAMEKRMDSMSKSRSDDDDDDDDDDMKAKADEAEGEEEAKDDDAGEEETSPAEPKEMAVDEDQKMPLYGTRKDSSPARASNIDAHVMKEVRRLAQLVGQMPKVMSDVDYAAMADHQARADDVYGAFGERAPAPLQGETANAYRIRLAKGVQKYSSAWKDVPLRDLPANALEIAERQIYADASAAARSPVNVDAGSLRAIRKRDAADRMITEFVGEPSAWMGEFRTAPRSITKPFFRPRQIGG